jgi:hypothetical protein
MKNPEQNYFVVNFVLLDGCKQPTTSPGLFNNSEILKVYLMKGPSGAQAGDSITSLT